MRYEYSPQSREALPVVVKNLLIINGLFLLVKILLGFDAAHISKLDTLLGLHSISSPDFKPWQVVTHMFMHAGPDGRSGVWMMHILSNMFALFMFGAPVERLWGAQRFLKYYMLCGLGAAALQMTIDYQQVAKLEQAAIEQGVDLEAVKRATVLVHISQVEANQEIAGSGVKGPAMDAAATDLFSAYLGVMVGASGAVFGILLAFGMFFPNVELMLLFFPIPIKAKYFVIMYGLFELYSGLQPKAGDNIAHFAHLGGMIFGFIVIRWWKKRELFF